MTYQIRTCVLTPQATAVVRATVRPGALPRWLPGAYRRVRRALEQQGVTVVGARFARYTLCTGPDGDRVEVEAGYPVSTPVVHDGVISPSGLPGGAVAVVAHLGRHDQLDATYRRLERWLDDRSAVPAGPCWEVYHAGPGREVDPRRWRTDVLVPYRADALACAV